MSMITIVMEEEEYKKYLVLKDEYAEALEKIDDLSSKYNRDMCAYARRNSELKERDDCFKYKEAKAEEANEALTVKINRLEREAREANYKKWWWSK